MDDAEFPIEAPSRHLAESWQRCRGVGLDREGQPQLEAVAEGQVRLLLQRDAQLTCVGQETLNTFSAAVTDTGHILLVIDDQGYIVAVSGDIDDSGRLLSHVRLGINLNEESIGTTAPGTVLVEQRPMFVRRGEHFLEKLGHMECLAAPIFRPHGDLIGVLSVCTESCALLPGMPDLIQAATLRMERQMLRELGSPMILRLHPDPLGLGCPSEGLIAIGQDCEVLGTNSLGARVLGVTQANAVGRPLGDFFDTDPMRTGTIRNGVARLRIHEGMNVFATLVEAPDLASRVAHAPTISNVAANNRGARAPADLRCVEKLTVREVCVLHHLDEGLTNSQIASAMFIGGDTVKYHLKNIYAKLIVGSRLQAISTARRLGLLH